MNDESERRHVELLAATIISGGGSQVSSAEENIHFACESAMKIRRYFDLDPLDGIAESILRRAVLSREGIEQEIDTPPV